METYVVGMDRLTDIKALRQRIGLTQKQLADAVEVKPNTVARWERGELGISTPMKNRIERVANSRGSRSAVARSSAVALDPHHQAILDALNRKLDPDAFEACAAALLRHEWPTLVPVRGGADDGFDGAVADPAGEPFPLVATTGEKHDDNLTRSLKRSKHRKWNCASALFATSRRITPATRRKLFDVARVRGVTLRQTYDQDWFAQRLYREPGWCLRLLGVTGGPAALSLFPVTQRPLIGDAVIGREREIRWLLKQESDCLLVGEPGSGKTFLLRSLVSALKGDARFLVDMDRTQIANDLRSLRPAAVIVDDAHVRPAQIPELDQIRREVGAEFRIIATSWPGAADAVRTALNVGRLAELRLDRIDADMMVEIIKSIGVRGPDRLLWMIRKQAAGRPGLAATLAHLCLTGNVQDVFSGASLVDELARGLGQIMDMDTLRLLAPFALGGAAGVRQVAVSQLLGRSLFDVSSDLAKLSAAGVIRERANGAVSVEPDPMRWIIVKRVFYDGPAALDVVPFLEVVEDWQDALHTLIGTRSRGAAIFDLERRLEETDSPRLWAMYAWLGTTDARYALERHPEFIHEIAQPALLNAPETAIPMLLVTMVGDCGRSGQSTTEGSIDHLKKWLKSSSSDGEHVIERRLALVRETVAWWMKTRKGDPAVRALCVALMPGFDYSVPDPGIGRTVSYWSEMLGDADLRAIVDLWPAVLNVVRESEHVPWRELFKLVYAWLVPQASFFPPVKFGDTTDRILRNFASTMLEGMAAVSRRHPGVQHRFGEFARHVEMDIELALHPEFEVLCPSESFDSQDWERQQRLRYHAIVELADNWRDRSLEDVASLLKWCEYEADLAGIDHPRLSAAFCAHLAKRVSDPVAAAEVLVDHALPSELVAPFFRKAAADRHSGWACIARRCLDADEYRWMAVETVLTQREAPSDLFAAALCGAADMPHLEDFMKFSRNKIPEVVTSAMLHSTVTRIAVAAAVGSWLDREREVPESFCAAWHQAILRSARGEASGRSNHYLIGEILSQDRDLASDWLVSNLTAESPAHWMTQDVAKTAAQSLGHEQRQNVLTRLCAADAVFAIPEVIKALVGGDLDLYRRLVDSEPMREHHLDPLEGSLDGTWREIVLIARDRGYSVQDVLHATLGRIRSWMGPASEMWAGERRGFEALLNDADDRIATVGRAGIEYTSWREQEATARETAEAVEGIH